MFKGYLYNYYLFIWMAFGFIIHIYDWYVILDNDNFRTFNNREKFKLIVPSLIIILYLIAFCKFRFLKKEAQKEYK